MISGRRFRNEGDLLPGKPRALRSALTVYAALAILVSVLVFVFYVARRHYESPPKAIPMLPKQSLLIRHASEVLET
jgi:hypothetical protein